MDKFDGHTFETLSKWTKGEIIKSPEYARNFQTGEPPPIEDDPFGSGGVDF